MERHTVINKFIDNLNKEYLEIGVQRGITFSQINCKNKDAVDPYPILEGVNIVNYKMTSDKFFDKECKKKYDFIFIDGLHETHQVKKDFENSYYNLNNEGIIFFDDILPKNEEEQRIPVSTVEGPCTGDVWKLIYHILINIENFDIKNIEAFINMPDPCRGILVIQFNKIIENNIFFKNIDNLSSFYKYKKDFNKYKNLLYKKCRKKKK